MDQIRFGFKRRDVMIKNPGHVSRWQIEKYQVKRYKHEEGCILQDEYSPFDRYIIDT